MTSSIRKNYSLRSLCLLILLAGNALLAAPALADELDHEQARSALQQGHILPLQQVLDSVTRAYPGQVMKIELERQEAQLRLAPLAGQPRAAAPEYLYEIRLLQADGRLLKLKVDAATGRVVEVKRKEH